MSRSGYSDDCDDNWHYIRFRGRVTSATRGARGQRFFVALLQALDAMPERRLIKGELICKEGVCAMGALASAIIGADVPERVWGETDECAEVFNISEVLAREVAYMNDEDGPWRETPEQRWTRMREWVVSQIRKPEGARS